MHIPPSLWAFCLSHVIRQPRSLLVVASQPKLTAKMAVYRDNRLVPLLIIATCIGLFYNLLDTTLTGRGAAGWFGSSGAPAYRAEPVSQQPKTNSLATSTASTLYESTSVATSTAPTSTTVGNPDTVKPSGSSHAELSADDVLLIMRTGGTMVYRRLLVHLATSLSAARVSPSNAVIYSDYAETIGDFTVVDALANLTSKIKSSPEFSAYTSLPQYVASNVYQESSNIEGDDYGPAGGWVLDKYKFLPMMQHAGKNWPRARWYVYMEDDTYLFLPNVLSYLSSFNSSEAHYLGSLAYKSNVTFAHGGSGFALSRKAWEMSFGQNPNLVDDLDKYTLEHGCGDQVLGHALNRYGVKFGENGGDEKFSWGFNPVVHWRFVFSRANWCKPLLSWHKVHGRDVARFYEFEKKWQYQVSLVVKPFAVVYLTAGAEEAEADALPRLFQGYDRARPGGEAAVVGQLGEPSRNHVQQPRLCSIFGQRAQCQRVERRLEVRSRVQGGVRGLDRLHAVELLRG